jgi:hypothetical protein
MLAMEEEHMATSAERIRVLRERQRSGFRRWTIDVSDDDLRAIAKRGYEGAVTADIDQQAQAIEVGRKVGNIEPPRGPAGTWVST